MISRVSTDKLTANAENYVSDIKKYTLLALSINTSLTIIKFTVGIIGHSQCVVADAVHTASDLSTDLLILFGVKLWASPADREHPYGHARIESIVTALIGCILAYIGIKIGYKAIHTIGRGHILPSSIAIIGPLLTIIIKSWLYMVTISFGRRIKSPAVIANARHQLSDVMSSIPALIGSVVPPLYPDLTIVDHIGAFVVSLFLMHFAWGVAMPALNELIDTGITPEKRREIVGLIKSVTGVEVVQDIRSRKLGQGFFLDFTILVKGNLSVKDGHDIAEQVKNLLVHKDVAVTDVIIHVKPFFDEQFKYECFRKIALSSKPAKAENRSDGVLMERYEQR